MSLKSLRQKFIKTYDAFILLEVVIALAIMTMSSVYFVTHVLQIQEFYCRKATNRNIEMVIDSLGDFVSRTGRLPYPSKSDGYEMEWPEDELAWEENPRQLMQGIVPYRTLGIPPGTAQDGYGYFFSYRMNPTLGGRKTILSVPPNDMREHLDIVSTDRLYLLQRELHGLVMHGYPAGDQIILDKRYSCYSSVRSYINYHHEEIPEEKVHTKTWDIAFRIPRAQLHCYLDGRLYEPDQEFFLVEPHQLNLMNSTARSGAFLAGLASHILFLDGPYSQDIAIKFRSIAKRPRECYRVKDCIALVLISHGKSHAGATLPNGQVVPMPPSASNEKKANGGDSPDPTQCYVNSTSGTGFFDDSVVWVSRFELATRARFPFRPGIVTFIDFNKLVI